MVAAASGVRETTPTSSVRPIRARSPRCVVAIQPVPTMPSRSRDPPPAVTPACPDVSAGSMSASSDGSRPTAPTTIAAPMTNAQSIASGSLAPPIVP